MAEPPTLAGRAPVGAHQARDNFRRLAPESTPRSLTRQIGRLSEEDLIRLNRALAG
jgi:hypothetical protein